MWSVERDVDGYSSGISGGLIGLGQYPTLAAECKSPGSSLHLTGPETPSSGALSWLLAPGFVSVRRGGSTAAEIVI